MSKESDTKGLPHQFLNLAVNALAILGGIAAVVSCAIAFLTFTNPSGVQQVIVLLYPVATPLPRVITIIPPTAIPPTETPTVTRTIPATPTDLPTVPRGTPFPTVCFPQTGWTPPKATSSKEEWLYDCLTSGQGNWVGQSEEWKAKNWPAGTSQSVIVSIIVPVGATRMGIACDPCTIFKPEGTTISSPYAITPAPFKPNISNIDVAPGQIYKAKIFGGDKCPTRASSPCTPEIYIYFNLPK